MAKKKTGTAVSETASKKAELDQAFWRRLTGTNSPDFAMALINQVFRADYPMERLQETDEKAYQELKKANYVALGAIGPRDGLEGLLAAQMLTAHHAGMESLRRAALEGQTFEGRNMGLNHAAKLFRLFLLQMEGLERYRGQGDVKVGSVNVNDGGQAIVGNVTSEKTKT